MQAPTEYLWSCKACSNESTTSWVSSRLGVRFKLFRKQFPLSGILPWGLPHSLKRRDQFIPSYSGTPAVGATPCSYQAFRPWGLPHAYIIPLSSRGGYPMCILDSLPYRLLTVVMFMCPENINVYHHWRAPGPLVHARPLRHGVRFVRPK